jgi:hypothetical protein
MGTKEDHKARIGELEEAREAIEDTGRIIEVDEADQARAVHDGQIQENVKWITVMESIAEVDRATVLPSSEGIDDALNEIKERVQGIQDAGYMPKTKPLLYYLDFLVMDLNRIKKQLEAEQNLVKVQTLTVLQYKCEAKIEMTIDWLKAQDTAGDWGTMILGDRGNVIKLPTFGNKAEVEEAIKTRHMPRYGETKEELIAGRVKRYRDDAKRISNGIDGQNTMDKEEANANQQ